MMGSACSGGISAFGSAGSPSILNKIDLVRIDLGDDNHDHLIDLNEVIRIAMARQ
jgi:hypothetical protein